MLKWLLAPLCAAALLPAQSWQFVPDVVYDQALDLRLELYLPTGTPGPHPTVVWIHGGGWANGVRSARGQANQLCPHGYAVVGIDYRLTGVAQWPAQIHDCKGAIRWLRAHAATYGLDPDRFAAWGSSAGGHLVAAVGTMGDVGDVQVGSHRLDLEGSTGGNLGFSSRVQAVVDWYGPTEFVRMREFPTFDHDSANSPESKLVGGMIQLLPDRAATANPITFLSADDPPILLMHGTEDTAVPYHQSELLWRAARFEHGLDATLFPVPATGHGGPGFNQNIQQVVDFLDRTLGDAPGVTVSLTSTDADLDEAGDPATFTVTRSGTLTAPLTLGLALAGSAEVGADYAPLPLRVTIPAGQAAVTTSVTALDDDLVEGAEQIEVALRASSAHRIDAAATRVVLTLADDESRAGLPVVTAGPRDGRGGERPGDDATLLVARTGSTAAPLTVAVRTTGTATQGADYLPLTNTVTIPAGASEVLVPVTPVDDRIVEPGEWVTLELVESSEYVLGARRSATAVLLDDESITALPIVSVILTQVEAVEDGSSQGAFTVTRTGPTGSPLTVPIAWSGRATRPGDYATSHATSVTIPAGAAWATVTVDGVQDGAAESTEDVRLEVLPAAGVLRAGQPGEWLELLDDDAVAPAPGDARLDVAPLDTGRRSPVSVTDGPAGGGAFLWIALAPGWVPFHGLGVWQLEPMSAEPLFAGVLDALGGVAWSVAVPDDVVWQGAHLWFQAFTFDGVADVQVTRLVERRVR